MSIQNGSGDFRQVPNVVECDIRRRDPRLEVSKVLSSTEWDKQTVTHDTLNTILCPP